MCLCNHRERESACERERDYTHTHVYTRLYAPHIRIMSSLLSHFATSIPGYLHGASGLHGSVTKGAVCLVIVAWQCFKWPGFQATVVVDGGHNLKEVPRFDPKCGRNELGVWGTPQSSISRWDFPL